MFEFSPVCNQFLAIICCNLLVFSFGLTSGWTTINLNELQNENSTLPMGKLSTGEGSLVVSLLFAGGFVGNFVILPISNYIGIKKTIHLFGVPLITSSLLILYAKNVYWLYTSRFLCGLISGGLVVAIPTFINEISNDNVRAALNSFYDIANNLGMIISFLLGSLLNWTDQAKCQLILPIIFLCVMFIYPESPEHWIKLRQEKSAKRSCRFYKGNICTLENVQFLPKHECIDAEYEQTKVHTNKDDSKLTFHDFLTPKAKRSIFIAFVSLVISFLSCATVMLSYITNIFEKTGSPFSSKYSSFLISLVQLFANIIFLNIVERFKRMTLYIWSSILTAIAYVAYGTYCWLWLNQDWC
ncbi:facilitated trehalose transporter Tret1-like [Contarinia nasturtii]|uniref:facilitated trehalose transporter Tret1-like n=1 Tax=Contarinia nasturtii TaxID=265458 RepID=UPI0012D3C86A|nr:facilitated trehalose transporter Tret1-like [Contarinia nasturtii]